MIAVFTTPAMGHLKPMLPVIAGLVAAGVPVTAFGHRAFEALLRRTGADFLPYPAVAYDIDAPDFGHAQMAADLLEAAEIVRLALLSAVEALAPRLILQDFMALWGSQIATALSIPRVHTVPTIVLGREAQRRMRQEDGLPRFVRDAVRGGPALARALWRTRFATTPQEAFALEGSWRRLAPPVAEIVFSLEAVQVGDMASAIPRHFVGPTSEPGRRFVPDAQTGHALITFGTLSNKETGRFAAAIRGAHAAGYPVVAQCGGKVDRVALDALAAELTAAAPDRPVRIVERVDDMETLIVGAALTIHHAGMATTWECVRFEKPALFIPTISDQKVLSGELQRLGLGVRLAPGREQDAAAIRLGVERVAALRPDWPHIATLLEQAGGAPAAVRVVTDLLCGHP